MPPNPGAIPKAIMATRLTNVSGAYLVIEYTVTASTDSNNPNKTTIACQHQVHDQVPPPQTTRLNPKIAVFPSMRFNHPEPWDVASNDI